MYGKTYMGVERSSFLIGADGTIEQALYKVKAKGNAAAVLSAIAD
jgi:peroxiredoxin Q/BCP